MCWFVKTESPILNFMTKIASDPELKSAYENDPKGTIKSHAEELGLSKRDQKALLTTDQNHILHSIMGRHAGV